jgi:outer membrane lipoprotein SlyB
MKNPITALKHEAESLYKKFPAHAELVALVHRGLAALEAVVEHTGPEIAAAVGAVIGGPAGAAIGGGIATIVEEEVPAVGAKLETAVDSQIPNP